MNFTTSVFPVFLLLLFSGLVACSPPDPNEQVDEGSFSENVYTSEELGWQITIPNGFDVTTREKAMNLQDTGRTMLEDSTGQEIDSTGLRNLIGFQKGQFNLFQSTSEPFVEEFEGEWSQTNAQLREIIIQAFEDEGIKVGASGIEKEEVGGLEFETYSLKLRLRNGVTLHQFMFSRLINGFDFGVNISYTDERRGEEMLKAWRASEFDF